MAGPALTDVERRVIEALMARTQPAELTVHAVAERTGIAESEVKTSLVKLGAEGAVHSETDARLGIEFWIALHEATERLDQPGSRPRLLHRTRPRPH